MGFPARLLMGVVVCGLALPALAAESPPVTTPRSVASLVSDTDAVAPGQTFHLALRLRLAPGWHTYWRNPGDAGIAPELAFTLPPEGEAGAVAWPAPQRQPEGPLMTFGYSGEVLLAAPVRSGPGAFTLQANWLVCKEVCIPEEATLHLQLPAGTPAPSAEAGLFAAAARAVPRPSPFPARISPDGTLTLTGAGLTPETVRTAWFLPETPDTVVAAAPQTSRVQAGRLTLTLRPGEAFAAATPLAGVLELRDEAGQMAALAVRAEPGALPEPQPAPPGMLRLLLLALAGGLVLNLMPCVFPVLAVKAAGLAGLAGAGRRRALGEALAYGAGVLLTFLAVGGALLGVRAAGGAAGWGFQFQSPTFVAAMAWVLLAVGLNLSGVFALATRFAGAGQDLAGRGGATGSFFAGLLAVLVATPCTAPFMGAAIGAALTLESPVLTEAVFAAMGLGLAAPYVVLALLPGVARALPRPGLWMVRLRQVLAFPMYGAVAWLVWVLGVQAGPAGVATGAAGCVLVGFAAWSAGTAQQAAGRTGRRAGAVAAVLALLAAGALLTELTQSPAPQATSESGAEPFSAARLAAERAAGHMVFVNMTAAWCITCQVNERVALERPEVKAAFAAQGVVVLRGDWTRQDPAITAYLRSFGRDGVPLYVLYRPGREGTLLPQILTPGLVLGALAAP